MRFIILENEINIRERIRRIIEKFYNSKREKCSLFFYNEGENVCKNIKKDNADCYLLDIETEEVGRNGYLVAKEIRQKRKEVLIVLFSDHIQYVYDGYEINVFRFLKKPIEEKKLWQTLDAVQKKLQGQQSVIIKVGRKNRRVILDQILYIEKQLRKAIIYLISGEKIYFYSTMEELHELFGVESFVQIQRSFIISMNYISEIQQGKVLLDTGDDFNIGRVYQKEVCSRLKEFMEKSDK